MLNPLQRLTKPRLWLTPRVLESVRPKNLSFQQGDAEGADQGPHSVNPYSRLNAKGLASHPVSTSVQLGVLHFPFQGLSFSICARECMCVGRQTPHDPGVSALPLETAQDLPRGL